MDDRSSSLAAVVKRLQVLEDRQNILDCVNRYSRGVDRHDCEILANVYFEEGIDEHGEIVNTGKGFGDWVNQRHDEDYSVHLHNLTTHNCEIIGDEAYCETYVLVGLLSKDEKRVRFAGGRYIDRMERCGGTWRIRHPRSIIEWQFNGDNDVEALRKRGYPIGKLTRADDSYQRPLHRPSGETGGRVDRPQRNSRSESERFER